MKILVVVPYFDEPHRWMISGQKAAYELAKKHQVVVLTTGAKTVTERVSKNLTVYRLKDWFIPDPVNYSVIPGLFSAVKRIVASEKIEACVINKNMFYSSLAIWPLKRLGVPVIIQVDTFPGINWFPRNPLVGVVMWLYARLIGNPILRKADTVVLFFEDLIPVAKRLKLPYRVIHNGIELEKVKSAPLPTDLKKKKGDIWVGYVGRLESVKGWYDLASAAKGLVRQNPKLHFFFAGNTDRAQDQISSFSHPQIHFLGLRRDVLGLNKLFDIFVMPSYSEGLSNAIMEAMAVGCACVVTNVGGNKFLINSAEIGLTFTPGDIPELKKQLKKLVVSSELRQRLGAAAQKKIQNEYNLEKSGEQLAQAITDART